MKKSKFLNLNEFDIAKWFIMCVLWSIFTWIWALMTNWGVLDRTALSFIILWGLGAGFGYIGKNLFTNSQDEVFTPEPIMPPSDVLKPLGLDTNTNNG